MPLTLAPSAPLAGGIPLTSGSTPFANASGALMGDGTSLNVKGFGAQGDGTTDDTAAIAAAIAAVPATGGVVYFPPGTYVTGTQTLATGVSFVGAGVGNTTIKAKAGLNAHLIQTTNFATLTGTDTTVTPYQFGVRDLTIDGNKANQGAGTWNGLALYGHDYRIQNVDIINCKGWGIWSEWASGGQSATGHQMEAFIQSFKVGGCAAGGLRHKGPHDAHIKNGIIYQNGAGAGTVSLDLPATHSNGTQIENVHIWGGNYDYGARIAASGTLIANCQCEGGLLAQLRYEASLNRIRGTKLFAGGINTATVKGMVIASGINRIVGDFSVEECGGGVLDLTGSGGDHDLTITGEYPSVTLPSPLIVGGANGGYDGNSRLVVIATTSAGVSSGDHWSPAQTARFANVVGYPFSSQFTPNAIETDLRTIAADSLGLSNQLPFFSYFTPDQALTVGTLMSASRGAAGATPTTCKMGLYSVDGSGNLTCIARTANDTTLWATSNTNYSRAITNDGQGGTISQVTLARGQRYAFAAYINSGAAMPQLVGANIGGGGNSLGFAVSPVICSVATGALTDLAATYASNAVAGTSAKIWGRMS